MSLLPQVPAADSLRHVVQRVLAEPKYQWTATQDPLAPLWRWLASVVHWLGQLQETHPATYWALLAASLVVLAAIFAHFAYLLWRTLRPARGTKEGQRAARPAVRDAAWYLTQTARLRADGRYADALAHRFLGLLLTLQDAGAVVFRPWKTPAEYVREAGLDVPGRAELGELVGALYAHLFGGAPCTGPDVDAFDRRAEGLVAHIAPR